VSREADLQGGDYGQYWLCSVVVTVNVRVVGDWDWQFGVSSGTEGELGV